MITVMTIYTIGCDKCLQTLTETETETQAIEDARREDWFIVHSKKLAKTGKIVKSLCADCAKLEGYRI